MAFCDLLNMLSNYINIFDIIEFVVNIKGDSI